MGHARTPRRLALLWLGVVATSHASAAPAKLAPAVVKYVAIGMVADKTCVACNQFVAGVSATALGSCKIVDGEIDPRGHCIAFSPKP